MSKRKGYKKPKVEVHSDECGSGFEHYHPPGRETIYGSVILLQDPSEEGIWYKSGHGFYWDDQSEHKNWRGIIDSLVRKIKHLVCCPVL